MTAKLLASAPSVFARNTETHTQLCKLDAEGGAYICPGGICVGHL